MLKFSLVSVVFFSALAFPAADADVPQILTATVGGAKFVSDRAQVADIEGPQVGRAVDLRQQGVQSGVDHPAIVAPTR